MSARKASLAPRAQRFLEGFGPAFQWPDPKFKAYHPVKNPEGVIASLAVAENSLHSQELVEYYNKHFALSIEHLKYRPGLLNSDQHNLCTAIVKFLNKALKPLQPIQPQQALVGPGVGGLLSHLLWYIASPGDGVLLTTPYYADYHKNIRWPSEANLIPVIAPPEVDTLSLAIIPHIRDTILNGDNNVKVLLLNNPHNPLASAYPEEVIIAYAQLAEEFNLHLVVDEVFANEVFPTKYSPSPKPFKSILSISSAVLGADPSRVHVLAGPTKDLGSSGVKLGALVSQSNPDVLQAVGTGLPVTPISSASDAIFTHIIDDEAFLDDFLERNRQSLSKAFEFLAKWCEGHNFPFIKAEAGVFALVDFASLAAKIEEDIPIIQKMDKVIQRIKAHGVVLRASTASQDPVPTRLRVIFTSPAPIMKVAFERIERAFDLQHVILDAE